LDTTVPLKGNRMQLREGIKSNCTKERSTENMLARTLGRTEGVKGVWELRGREKARKGGWIRGKGAAGVGERAKVEAITARCQSKNTSWTTFTKGEGPLGKKGADCRKKGEKAKFPHSPVNSRCAQTHLLVAVD